MTQIIIKSNLKIGKGKGFNLEDIGKIQISSKKLTKLIGERVPVTVTIEIPTEAQVIVQTGEQEDLSGDGLE